jgi:hypothetical protein
MSKRYEDAFGVVPLTWHYGEPTAPLTGQLVLVEVWRAETNVRNTEARKPRVQVEARLELRFWDGSSWQLVGWSARTSAPTAGAIRRYAYPGRSRTWSTTVVVEGWA